MAEKNTVIQIIYRNSETFDQGSSPAKGLAPDLFSTLLLLQFDIDAILDLVHGEADAGGITALVKVDASERGGYIFGSQGLGHGVVIRGTGLLDGIQQRQSCGIGV